MHRIQVMVAAYGWFFFAEIMRRLKKMAADLPIPQVVLNTSGMN